MTSRTNTTQPSIADLEASLAEIQAKLDAAREADTLMGLMDECRGYITDTEKTLKDAAAIIEKGDADALKVMLADAIDHLTTALHTLDPKPASNGTREPLRPLVEAYLKENKDTDHTPSTIASKIGRKAGGVGAACDAMVRDGEAVQTSDKPKKYQIKTA